MRILTLLSAAALAGTAAPAMAQDVPDAAQVAESLAACRAVTTADWIHLDQLRDHDFRAAEARGRGVSKRKVRGLYAKKGNDAYIIASKDELDAKQCVVSAALADTAAYGPLAQELSAIIGMPARQDGPAYFWDVEGKQIKIEPEGDADEPYARFTVTALPAD
ncbi:hypothetical protein WJT74_08310 [Sphingomicrobium sp. XHP0239]|uniref:hypothetical protein n=1 Tax=Sphingomicrobium maritimum TaxID=3133972 RepID=UPI0031CC5B24